MRTGPAGRQAGTCGGAVWEITHLVPPAALREVAGCAAGHRPSRPQAHTDGGGACSGILPLSNCGAVQTDRSPELPSPGAEAPPAAPREAASGCAQAPRSRGRSGIRGPASPGCEPGMGSRTQNSDARACRASGAPDAPCSKGGGGDSLHRRGAGAGGPAAARRRRRHRPAG